MVALILTTLTYFVLTYLSVGQLLMKDPTILLYLAGSYGVLIKGLILIIITILYYVLLSPIIVKRILGELTSIERGFDAMTFQEMFFSSIGVVVGLVIANLLGIVFMRFGFLGALVIVILNISFGYLGYKVALRKNREIKIFEKCDESNKAKSKILDTSVIIDGRILDILRTGFIEGKVIIPQFVLAELRHVADSSDSLKRNRGRRGLDILNEIQKQLDVNVEIVERDFKNIPEVDSKILKLAEEMDASIVTNDFNLNKVADFKGVLVLNINELSNAVKPIVLPGEDMTVTVIKDGKEHDQGVGYLNDGTMIVIEGGRKAIGQTVDVLVTSVLQTAAGRMIFTKIK